jgi:hypothetical protein
MTEQLLACLTEQVRDNILFKQYRREVLGLGDLLAKRCGYREALGLAERVLSQKKAALLASGRVDGKNEQLRAAQLAEFLLDDEEARTAQREIEQAQLMLSGTDIAVRVAESMLAFCHDEARVLAAALQAAGVS